MKFLASATCEEAMSFTGKLVIPNEDSEMKPHQVLLNIVTDNDSVFSSLTRQVHCITFKSHVPETVPEGYSGKVFCEVSISELESTEVPEGATLLVRLDKDYCNMRELYDYSTKYPNARFIGGNLLGIPGVKIGRFDSSKKPVVCNEVYDDFVEVKLSELDNLQEIVKQVKVKLVDGEEVVSKRRKGDKKAKTKKTAKPSKATKKVAVFSSLFGSDSVDF